MRPTLLALAALSLAACSRPNTLAAFEGSITMHTTAAGADPHDLVVEAKGDKLRIDMPASQQATSHVVYDQPANKVTLFFDSQKQYSDLDFAAPSAPAPSTNSNTASIVKAGQQKVVAGYPCEQWSVKDAAGHRSDVCLAQGVAFLDLNRLRSGGPETPLARQFREQKSFPLESVDYDASGKELSRMEVTKIEPRKLDDAAFAVPAGYTKAPLPGHGK